MKYSNCLLVSLLLMNIGCRKNEPEKMDAPAPIADTLARPEPTVTNAFVTNPHGDTLKMQYDNNKGSAVFQYKGEAILLQQDTMASGIKYSNKDFEYTEWHGESTLKKNNQVIFSNR